MLVLSRKPLEKIIIDNSIEVQVVEIRGDKVRLGITAPNGVSVNREEIQKVVEEHRRNEERLAEAEATETPSIWGMLPVGDCR